MGRLRNVMTHWRVVNIGNATQLQAWNEVSQLTSLTQMFLVDALDLFDNRYDMHELLCLPKLHTVKLLRYTSLATRVPNYTRLQRLHLGFGRDERCNLSCLTKLTQLDIMDDTDSPILRQLILPGEGNQLQKISVVMWHHSVTGPHEVFNLDKATNLTKLMFVNINAANLRDGGWPSNMPSLCNLAVMHMDYGPPQEWCLYPNLRTLNLKSARLETLPTWFYALTQLDHLILDSGTFYDGFPSAVLSLSIALFELAEFAQ